MEPLPFDRRSSVRSTLSRRCKLFHPASHRYSGAETTDVSYGGTRVVCDLPRPLTTGERIQVVVAWEDRPVLRAEDMVNCRVCHVETQSDGRQALGLSFESAVPEAQVALAS